jgi:hypothetical protein
VEVEGMRRQAYRDTRGPGLSNASRMLALVARRPGARGARDFAIQLRAASKRVCEFASSPF